MVCISRPRNIAKSLHPLMRAGSQRLGCLVHEVKRRRLQSELPGPNQQRTFPGTGSDPASITDRIDRKFPSDRHLTGESEAIRAIAKYTARGALS